MREIKFRGFNSEIKRMFYPCKSNGQTLSFYDNRVEVDLWRNDGVYDNVPVNFLMQYTGLKDKNGVDIYEGDILDFDETEWRGEFKPEAVPAIDKLIGDWGMCGSPADVSEWRAVIGNIYENPELLGG